MASHITKGWHTGWPRKNGTAYFPQYVDAITGIRVWGNFSWEKLCTKITNFGLIAVCFLRHILWDNVETQNFRFSAYILGMNECHSGFPQLWAVIQLTLSMRILYTRNPLLTKRIDKITICKWITAHNCGKPNCLDIVSQNVP